MQNKSIWIVEYYEDYKEKWEVEGFFFTKEEAKEYCDLKNGSDAYYTYYYEERKPLDLQEYKSKFYTIWYVRIIEWEKVVMTDTDLSLYTPDYYINHWEEENLEGKKYELGFCFHTASEQEAIELALERAKVVKAEFERLGDFNKACEYLEQKHQEEHKD